MADFLSLKNGDKKIKPSGWAAFDRRMRGNVQSESDYVTDPFPPVTDYQIDNHNYPNLHPSSRSFSSVVRSHVNFNSRQYITESENLDQDFKKIIQDISDQTAENDALLNSIARLKTIHGWADEILISDILSGVDNDEAKASALLKDMMAPTFYPEDSPDHKITPKNKSINNVSEKTPVDRHRNEDQVYLSHRKDAIRMMRTAAKHSRGASNAYVNGNHPSAKQLSQKAREEWLAAEGLNKKAAQEILLIKNSNNNIWKLDLHGLHSSEVEHILKEHLFRIESHLSVENSAPYKAEFRGRDQDGLLAESFSNTGNRITRPSVLHVITGTGNHSRGPASLPAVVRGFLNENGYRFDEVRPGVIAVWPKFRRQSSRETWIH